MWFRALQLVCLISVANAFFNITIIHTNDMHARIEEFSDNDDDCNGRCYGGFARVKFLVDQLKRRDNNVLFLNAGDNFGGTTLYKVFKEKIISDFIDMLGIDAMSLGNHEFDEGPETLARYLKKVKTPTVAANIDLTKEPSFNDANIHPWHNFTVEGVQIAVVGYLTPDTQFLSTTGKVKFFDEIPSIKNAAREAKEHGAKLVIALGHSGAKKDTEIAKKVEEVDIVVGGHSHTLYYNGDPPDKEIPVASYPDIVVQPSGKRVPVVQAFAFTKYLGYLQLSFDDTFSLVQYSGNPILLDSIIGKDSKIEKALEPWKKKIIRYSCTVVGETKVDLDGHCMQHECNFGNLLTDAMVYMATKSEHGLSWSIGPIAFVNGGRIRSSIPESKGYGHVCNEDIKTAIPFEDNVLILQISGRDLKEILEISVEDYSHNSPKEGFLQFSGIRVVYDLAKLPMNRVLNIEVRCWNCSVPIYEPLSFTKMYRVVTTTFLWDGGHNYKVLRSAPVIKSLGVTLNEVVRAYVERHSPIYPGLEQRITLVNYEQPASTAACMSWSLLCIVPLAFHLW